MPQGKLVELMGAVQSGMMSLETFFYNLRLYEVYPPKWTDEDEVKAIDEAMNRQAAARESEMEREMMRLRAEVAEQNAGVESEPEEIPA
jgi:hypothetical protein